MQSEAIEREVHTGLTEEQWLALRERDLTSTEISAIWGVSPYETPFELYHRKAGTIASGFKASERTEAGQFLEPAIAALIAHRESLTVEPLKGVYARVGAERMGSSFDYSISEDSLGLPDEFQGLGDGYGEVKNLDYLVFRDSWENTAGEIQAPLHIELQLQYQMLVGGRAWGAIFVLVSGNTPHIIYRLADPAVAAKLRRAAADFWAAVDAGTGPLPEYERDGEVLKRLYAKADPRAALPEEVLGRAMNAVAREVEASETIKAATADKETARAEIMDIMKSVELALLPDGSKISWKATKAGTRMLRVTGAKPAVEQEAA